MLERLALLALVFLFGPASQAAESSPRETLATLNALRLDPEQIYALTPADGIEMRLGDMVLTFEEGKIAFFQPFEGKVTGFVFSGLGHTLALPRDPAEKQQMARFLGAPVLDQRFVSLYARCTDESAKNLADQLEHAAVKAAPDAAFAAVWLPQLERLNPTHSLRILTERYSAAPRHFFHAGIDGILTGPFDILLDDMRYENFTLGQPRSVNKVVYYDVWTSYALPNFSPPPSRFDASHYQINTTIRSDNSLEGDASVDFRAVAGGERILFVQLARSLKVDSISSSAGESLGFFQNEGLTEQELRTRGDDTLCIFLPRAPNPGETFSLRFRYRGNVIENYGNSVLYVGNRESWYPHFGDPSAFARYDLTFRWPKQLRLVATGVKGDESEDGEFRVAHWKSGLPVPEAGFNLGEYAVASLASSNHTVEVYANKQLEQAILARLTPPVPEIASRPLIPSAERPEQVLGFPNVAVAPSPADALKSLAREVDSSIAFYEKFSGPFPFQHLAVSQIPGGFGQGWPGLLYLSTYSFLPPETQERVGLTSTAQAAFTDIIPVHEVAHQWWGNVVGWSSYRDQWINEGLSVYLALLFADSQKNSNHALTTWLTRYRKRLATKPSDSEVAPAEQGPVVMGIRLVSSKSPDAYDIVAYSKGAWIFHMLREMLREPNSKDPDNRFTALLHTLVTKYAQRALSTEQLQKEIEAASTPRMALEGGHSMEWFFQQYVKGTGIPRYKVEFTSHRTEKGYQIRGKLYQYSVPPSFIAPVPIYLAGAGNRNTLLGTVIASGEETSFSFHTQNEPHKLLVDPKMTLLCVTE
jgi:hypothetical protein